MKINVVFLLQQIILQLLITHHKQRQDSSKITHLMIYET